jgi:hypothetical protein
VDQNVIALIACLGLAIGWAMFSTGLAMMLRGSEPLPPRLRVLATHHSWPGEPIPTGPSRRAATFIFGTAVAIVCVMIPATALLNGSISLTEMERWLFISDLLFMAGWGVFLVYAYARDRQIKTGEIKAG